MEEIIKKAIEGGYYVKTKEHYFTMQGEQSNVGQTYFETVCDPLFWQALGKSCGWTVMWGKCIVCFQTGFGKRSPDCTCNIDTWKNIALGFHEINLTEGWNKAVEYLQALTIKEE